MTHHHLQRGKTIPAAEKAVVARAAAGREEAVKDQVAAVIREGAVARVPAAAVVAIQVGVAAADPVVQAVAVAAAVIREGAVGARAPAAAVVAIRVVAAAADPVVRAVVAVEVIPEGLVVVVVAAKVVAAKVVAAKVVGAARVRAAGKVAAAVVDRAAATAGVRVVEAIGSLIWVRRVQSPAGPFCHQSMGVNPAVETRAAGWVIVYIGRAPHSIRRRL